MSRANTCTITVSSFYPVIPDQAAGALRYAAAAFNTACNQVADTLHVDSPPFVYYTEHEGQHGWRIEADMYHIAPDADDQAVTPVEAMNIVTSPGWFDRTY